MFSRKPALAVVCLVLLLALPALGQDETGRSYRAQYSVPFGVITGELLLLGDYLVFHDAGQPESSFVVPRGTISALTVDGIVVNIDTTGPVHDRAGARTQFSFRLDEGIDVAPIVSWHGRAASAPASGEPTADGSYASEPEMVFTAKHDHRFGSCRGQLIIREGLIAYDSLNDIGHSRRWELIDIKEMKQKNPYQLSIEGFRGGTYNMELQGSGMDPDEFKLLVDRITRARTNG